MMKKRTRISRRSFLHGISTSAVVMSTAAPEAFDRARAGERLRADVAQGAVAATPKRSGSNSPSSASITGTSKAGRTAVIRGGGELVAMYAKEPDLTAAFLKRFPRAKLTREREGESSRTNQFSW